MAQNSWPSPSHNAGALTEAEWERTAARDTDNGIDGDPTNTQLVVAGVGLQVTVKAEKLGSVRGHLWYAGTTDYTHAIAANASGSTRVDRVVLRLDRSTWEVRSAIRQGTPGSGAPALTQDTGTTGLFEIPLAQVTVANNASSVTVSREEQYVGTRIRAADDGKAPPNPQLGEVHFRPNTGRWRGWNGSSWVTLYEDSGWVTLGLGYSTWDHFIPNVGRRRDGWASIRIGVRRTGSTFTTTDADGSFVATVPADLRPLTYNVFQHGFFSNGAGCRAEIRSNGEVWVRAYNQNVTVNQSIALTLTYPIGVA